MAASVTLTIHEHADQADIYPEKVERLAFDEGADVMVVAIHHRLGVQFLGSFDSTNRRDETPLGYVGEDIRAALENSGVLTR